MELRRRCKSILPWSLPDFRRYFFLDQGHPLYVDDADIDLEQYTTVREITREASSVILVLDEIFVLKMRANVFDVEAIVAFMRLASTVVPVPHVYKWGHSGNCSFVLMEYIPGYELDSLKKELDSFWISVMAKVEKQIEIAVHRLADVGLSHNDLYPRNVIINSSWEIVGIVGWDYCAPFDPAREYLSRLAEHISFNDNGDEEPWNPWQWNHIFLKHVYQRDLLDLAQKRSNLYLFKAPLLQFPCQHVESDVFPPRLNKPHLLTRPAEKRRIAIMTSTSVLAVQRLLEACATERIPQACICLLITDQPAHCSPFSNHVFGNMAFPIIHLPPRKNVYDDWGKIWLDYDEDVTRRLVSERPDMIIQVGWTFRLDQPFVDAVSAPRLLTDDNVRPSQLSLGWIRPGLPDNDPDDFQRAIPWQYDAFQRGDITETGFSVMRLSCGVFQLGQVQEVPMWKEETFDQFEARMLDIESELVVEIGSQGLEGIDPVAC